MADRVDRSPLSPTPRFPERINPVWERKFGQNTERKGRLYFEEGLGTDSDVPNSFIEGVMQGYRTAPGRPNRNDKVDTKGADETMRERAHAGSAAWVEAPTFLGNFVAGQDSDNARIKYETVVRDGGRYQRVNPAQIND